MMTEEQKQALIKHNIAKINSITPHFMKEVLPGVKRHLQCEIDSAKLALDSLGTALNQPASPALKLPENVPCSGAPDFIWLQVNGDSGEPSVWPERAWDVVTWNDERIYSDDALYVRAGVAPHTAPIEPICSTGGAEWVKVSERMPKSLKPVVISGPFLGDMVGYWNINHWEIEGSHWDKDDVTQWYEYPAAPEEK